MQNKSTYTTLAAWAVAVSWALKAQGVDAVDVFASAGLTLSDYENKPSSRIPIENMTQLWESSVKATQSPAFGLEVCKYVHPVHFKALGMLIVSCKNLAQTLEKIVSYHALISDSVKISIHYTPNKIGLNISAIEGVNISPVAIDAFFSVVVKFYHNMMGAEQLVASLDLIRSEPKSPTPWLQFFDADIHFNQTENCLWMYRSFLEKSSLHFDEKVFNMNESAVQDYLESMQANTWAEKCRKLITLDKDGESSDLVQIASELNLSERTLARRLKDEGTSFSQILQQKKQDLASYYLLETNESIISIALSLGFKDASNFNRAFQRWFKTTPCKYRTELL